MRPIDADEILCDGFNEWLGCVLCGQATKEHPSCDGACDMQARLYADRAADALISWLADVPTIDAEPVRHGHWENGETCSVCRCGIREYCYDLPIAEFPCCPFCGAIMDAMGF